MCIQHRKLSTYTAYTVRYMETNACMSCVFEFLSIPVCISLTMHVMCRTCGVLYIIPVGKNSPLKEWECERGEVSPRHSTALIHSVLYDRLIPTIAQSNTIQPLQYTHATVQHGMQNYITAQYYKLLVKHTIYYFSYLVIYYHKI